jgi:K+-sensing histidine kinase KdpD
LTSLVFALADQEGIRSRLAGETDLAGIIAAARALYLHYSPAREAVFFRPGRQDRFEGLPAAGQSRLVEGLATSPAGANLLAEALRSGRLRHSFHPNAESLSAFDRQLVTLCKGSGIACLPLRSGDRTTGAVVLGLDSREGIETLGVPPLLQLGSLVARALIETPAHGATPAGGGSPGNALPRKLAHEIRTPLAVIGNYMSAVGMMLEGTENAGVVAAVEKEIKRIGDILAYYTDPNAVQPENESPEKPPEAVVRAAVESLGPTLLEPKKIEVITDFAPGIEPVAASPVVLEQILVNLLKNAAEALPEGGRITLATREERTSRGGRQVVVSVEDNGPGIEDAIWQRLFSPVVSTKGEGHAGLGLSIVKGLADDIGAAISCRTFPERGTRFELAIPRRET